ncbi:restriction endonuclease subunit S [Microbacterium sp. MC2]
MSEWRTGTLSELVAEDAGIKSGPFGTALSASEYSAEGVPVISVGEVGYGEFRIRDDTPRVDQSVTSRLGEYVLREGDIVFGRKGAVDRSAWVSAREAGWFLGSDGLRVRTRAGVDSRFVAFQLRGRAVRDWLLQHAGGSTLLSLNQSTLARVPVAIPPLPEQQAIAEVLGALDDKIAANTTLAAVADNLIRAEYETLSPTRTVRIGEIALSPRDSAEPRALDPNTIYVGLEHIPRKSMWLDASGVADDVTSGKTWFRESDVLFGKLRPYFHKVVLAPVDGICSTDVLVVRAKDPDMSSMLISALSSDLVVREVVARSEGTRMPRTSWKDLSDVEIAWPEAQERLALSRRLHAVCTSVRSILAENRTLAATRDALLPQLMSGKIRVRDAERIAEEAGA